MKYKLLLIFIPIIFFSGCTDEKPEVLPIKQRQINTIEDWYPNGSSPSDTLLLPIIVDAFISVENIQGLKTNKEDFRLDAITSMFLPIKTPYIDFEKDTIFNPDENFLEPAYIFDTAETYLEEFYKGPITFYDDDLREFYNSDTIFEISDRFSFKIFHDWDLRKYPFDNQKLKFNIQSVKDTSQIRFRYNKLIPSTFSIQNDLQKGFKLEGINFKEEFIEKNIYGYKDVYSKGVFEIEISRGGSWIFIKLFFGGFLALIISWLVFLIPLRDFSSRIELSIGAVFAAVGNKYFVDSAVDSQILTVADLFNNIIIFMVVLNVGLIILKRNQKFKNKLINDTRTVSRISIYTALILFGLLTIYTIS
tara:strand:+ start:875 stop:1963 length:1089 start_codon:yes stop_codon:yes gene_type:complete